jgi:hypothetical protein
LPALKAGAFSHPSGIYKRKRKIPRQQLVDVTAAVVEIILEFSWKKSP